MDNYRKIMAMTIHDFDQVLAEIKSKLATLAMTRDGWSDLEHLVDRMCDESAKLPDPDAVLVTTVATDLIVLGMLTVSRSIGEEREDATQTG